MTRKKRIMSFLYWRTSNGQLTIFPLRSDESSVSIQQTSQWLGQQANGQVFGRQRGTCDQVSTGQAGRQATSKGNIVRGFPVWWGVWNPSSHCLLGPKSMAVELRVYHMESEPDWVRLASFWNWISFTVNMDVVSGSLWICSPQTKEEWMFHDIFCRDPIVTLKLQQLGEEVSPVTLSSSGAWLKRASTQINSRR